MDDKKYNYIRNVILNSVKDCKTTQAINAKLSNGIINIDDNNFKTENVITYYTEFLSNYNPTLIERFFYINNSIKEMVLCKQCKTIKPAFKSLDKGYRDFCSVTCSNDYKKNNSVNKTITEDVLIEKQLNNELVEFIKKYTEIELNHHIGMYRVDIFIPKHNVAIDFNMLFADTELKGKTKYYFTIKKDYLLNKGIDIFNIFEDEFINSPNIIKSMILNKIGKNPERVFARKCKIRKVNNKKCRDFLNNNHLQGSVNSRVGYGLYYNMQLVSLITIGLSRYNTKYKYELHRFCSRLGHSVVGAFSKLMKHAIKDLKIENMITYADRRIGVGNVYLKTGFNFMHNSDPNYFYVKKENGLKRQTRVTYQHHKLESKLEIYDANKTEIQNMRNNGFDRLWDAGNATFELMLSEKK